MTEEKPYLKYPVKGDIISPWVYDGNDWVKIGSPEYEKLIQYFIDQYKEFQKRKMLNE